MPHSRVIAASLARVAVIFLAFIPAPSVAYQPTLSEIYSRILDRSSEYTRAIIETQNYVYDNRFSPMTPDAESEDEPPNLSQWNFHQKIYWLRDGFLAIETSDLNGKLLHFYFDEGFGVISVNLDSVRRFEDSDVLHPYLPFLSESRLAWEKGATTWGILPQSVAIHRNPKGVLTYGLQESPGKTVWVETIGYRPIRVDTFALGEEQSSALSIEFGPLMIFGNKNEESKNLAFPRSVLFMLNGVLFKTTILKSLNYNPSMSSFPRTRLRNLARKFRSEQKIKREES